MSQPIPNNVLEYAITEAKLADHRFRIGAVIYEKGFIKGYGHNKPNKTHPKANTPYKTIHAEFDALLDAIRQSSYDFTKSSIYIHRLKKDDSPGLAKPCKYCEVMLAWAGIKDIKYSLG